MRSRRSLAALAGLLALLLGTVLLTTASSDSSLGRTRAQLGDAVSTVGDALTVPSPTPTPTVVPVTDVDVRSRIAAQQTRDLVAAATAKLASPDKKVRMAAVDDYNAAIGSLTDVRSETDGVAYDELYADMADLNRRLKAMFPSRPSATASATATATPS